MGEQRRAVEQEREVVDVAVPPVLAGLVGLDDGVASGTEVAGGVTVGGVVAAADVTAGHAHAQVHPLAADAQAVLAALAARRHVGDLVEMAAGLVHAKSRGASWSAGMMPSRPAW